MLEQTGNALTFYAFYMASKVGKTGLTVTVNVRRGSTSVVTGGSATELGDGLYAYTLSSGSVSAENEYTAVFKTSDTSVDQKDIPALWVVGKAGVEDLDAAVSSRADGTDYTGTRAAKLDNLDAAVTTRAAAADYTSTRAAKLDNLDAAVSTRLASGSYSAPPSAASVADAVWDEALSGHAISGSTGEALDAAGASGDPWATDLSSGYTGDQAGKYLGDVRAKALLITAENVQFTNPVDPITGSFTITRGDDYTSATGRTLPQWSSDDWTPFSLTTAQSVSFKARARFSETVFEQAVTVLSDTQVQVELTAAQTDALLAGGRVYAFDLEAVLDGGEVVTLAQGEMTVVEDVR